MSVFRVALNNIDQGVMDLDPTTNTSDTYGALGTAINPSIQRQVFVMGPGKINRLLIDGATFTDCNYWKQYAYPQVTREQAIVEVVTDDGSVYSDVPGENVFPKVFTRTIAGGSTFATANNIIDMAVDAGGNAIFAQIENQSGAQALTVRLNGDTDAVFDLSTSETQVFNAGEMVISQIAFDNSLSGAVAATVQVLVSVKSTCTS
tara:strand:- start:14788 stop:15402 length:615 start_codon:yes stop_codon:yes gene_type:complete